MRFFLGIFHVLFSGFGVLVEERRWKIIPALGIFVLLSILLVLVKAIAPIAPFVYSLF